MMGLVSEFDDLEGVHVGSGDDKVLCAHDLVDSEGVNDVSDQLMF